MDRARLLKEGGDPVVAADYGPESNDNGRGLRGCQIAAFIGTGLVLENRHGRRHSAEAETLVKPSLPGTA